MVDLSKIEAALKGIHAMFALQVVGLALLIIVQFLNGPRR